jgi:hypothetical protein
VPPFDDDFAFGMTEQASHVVQPFKLAVCGKQLSVLRLTVVRPQQPYGSEG